GYMVRTGHGHELYDPIAQKQFQNSLVSARTGFLPFVHPAYEALFFVPISFLSYRAAYYSFLICNCGIVLIVFQILKSHLARLYHVWKFLPAALVIGFFPLSIALMNGQDSVILLLLLTSAMLCLDRGQEPAAGVLVGLGLFKFQIAL